jgi:hypothetical protein
VDKKLRYLFIFGDINGETESKIMAGQVESKLKVNFALEQAMKAHRGSSYSSTTSLTSVLGGMG